MYEKELKHELKEINYQLFNDKLIIIMEESVTQPELVLNESSKEDLAKKVRNFFDQILQPQIKSSIEEVLKVTIIDFLSDTTIETSRTAAIAIFQLQPVNPSSETISYPSSK